MTQFRGMVRTHNEYGWIGYLWIVHSDGEETSLGSEKTLTRWGAKRWIRRRSRSLAKTARRESRDTWFFEV